MSSAGAPERIGRYEIYSEIASGGMATVCFGRQIGHVGFARTVAIKRLHPQVARDPEFVQMFLDEARLATRIHNAHVVQTLDVVASGGELLLIMEYVHGEALSKLLTTVHQRNERIEARIAIAIATGILEGLHAAHEARSERGVPLEIVHRDVSPQNVLVGMDGIARVFDFGIAKASDRIHTTQDGLLKGKIAYMAPEQLENGPVDRRADIWAASVVLWEMLAGRRLFVADSQPALAHVVLTRDVPPVSGFGLPKRLDPILARGLARDRVDRYSSATEMALELEEAFSPAPARVVASWVDDRASADLEARAQVLEKMGDQAALLRPSGATKVEVAALISDEPAALHKPPTLLRSGDVPRPPVLVLGATPEAIAPPKLPSASRDAFTDEAETVVNGEVEAETVVNGEVEAETVVNGEVAALSPPVKAPHERYADFESSLEEDEPTALHSKPGVTLESASPIFDDSDETRNAPLSPKQMALARSVPGFHLPMASRAPMRSSHSPLHSPSSPPESVPLVVRPRPSMSLVVPGVFVAGVFILLILIAAQLHRRTRKHGPSHTRSMPNVEQTIAVTATPVMPPPTILIAPPYVTIDSAASASSASNKTEPAGTRRGHPRQPPVVPRR